MEYLIFTVSISLLGFISLIIFKKINSKKTKVYRSQNEAFYIEAGVKHVFAITSLEFRGLLEEYSKLAKLDCRIFGVGTERTLGAFQFGTKLLEELDSYPGDTRFFFSTKLGGRYTVWELIKTIKERLPMAKCYVISMLKPEEFEKEINGGLLDGAFYLDDAQDRVFGEYQTQKGLLRALIETSEN
jgi:hypothetical protein